MSILNKAIITGGLVMGVAFSAMAHPELKLCATGRFSRSGPGKDSAQFLGKSDREILRCKINDDGYERHVITFSDAGRGKSGTRR